MKYEVWSTHVSYDKEVNIPPHDELEVTRTDPKVANEDRSILQDILHRKAWIKETEA
jgi:hypothetical protein